VYNKFTKCNGIAVHDYRIMLEKIAIYELKIRNEQ